MEKRRLKFGKRAWVERAQEDEEYEEDDNDDNDNNEEDDKVVGWLLAREFEASLPGLASASVSQD